MAVVTATRPSRRRSFDRFNYLPSKGETSMEALISWYKQMYGVLLSVAGNYIVNSIN